MRILKFTLLVMIAFSVYSQETKNWIDRTLDGLGLSEKKLDESKAIDFSIIPGPFYNPEMKLGLGVSAMGLYRADREDKDTQISSLVLNGLVSVNGTFGLQAKNKTFYNGDENRFYVDAEMTRAPEDFYGVGYSQNSLDDSKVSYDSRYITLKPILLRKLVRNTFLGVGYDFKYNKLKDVGNIDTSILSTGSGDSRFPEDTLSSGMLIKVFYDSRDFLLNARRGTVVDFEYGVYRQELGSETDFSKVMLEFSHYISNRDLSNTLALQFRGDFSSGDVPWDQMALIGGSFGLRGYYEGRYRDKQSLTAQAEYRIDLPWRHGAAVWAGLGVIAENTNEFDSEEILPNYGIGYRLEVKEGVNVRFDLGFGEDESGFYMNIGEAF